jgi:hypothetical protein
MRKFFLKEEFLVPALIFLAVFLAFSPYLYELVAIGRRLPAERYPLIETDYAPDARVYLSRMREGFDGAWLVSEKYTAEPHRPSILHISYLAMGKLAGLVRITPVPAFFLWRLLIGLGLLLAGYLFISQAFSGKTERLLAFLLFVFVGNIPILARNSIPVFGHDWSFYLGWYTYFDPAKRIIFLPHYNLGTLFLISSLLFWPKKKYWLSGLFAMLAVIVLPQTVVILGFIGGLSLVWEFIKTKKLIIASWPFWLLLLAGFLAIKYSLSYFPWNVQGQADLTKRDISLSYCKEALFGLGPTGILGLIGAFWVIIRRRTKGYPAAFWILGIIFGIIIFTIFPVSNGFRFFQIDLHLPLAITTVILLKTIANLFKSRKGIVFGALVFLVLLPSFITWPVSLKGQTMFIDQKIAAGYPLIPQLPYVVYPIRPVMEAVNWLKDNTDHQQVVLAAQTLGSMIPAYAGNYVFLGHSNQTVYFDSKLKQMQDFYSRRMNINQMKQFLSQNRISWVFYGPEEAGMGKIADLTFLKPAAVFRDVIIYRYDGD